MHDWPDFGRDMILFFSALLCLLLIVVLDRHLRLLCPNFSNRLFLEDLALNKSTTFAFFTAIALLVVIVVVLVKDAGAKSEKPAEIPVVQPLEWKYVSSTGLREMNTQRAKVPGGWLVTIVYKGGGRDSYGGMAFVPDADHSWQIGDPKTAVESEEK